MVFILVFQNRCRKGGRHTARMQIRYPTQVVRDRRVRRKLEKVNVGEKKGSPLLWRVTSQINSMPNTGTPKTGGNRPGARIQVV